MSAASAMPRPVLLALAGVLAGVGAALTAGELVWYVLKPAPLASPETQLDSPQPEEALMRPRAPQPARLALSAAPVAVYPGGKNVFGVRVRRDGFDGPLVVRFDSADGLSAAEVAVPAGSDVGATELTAAPDAKPGTYTLAASVGTAEMPALRARTTVAVTVLAPPPAAPRLAVGVSPSVPAYQKGKNALAVRVARGDFDEPVTVTFDGIPDGVTIPPVTVPLGKTDATAEVTVAAGTKLGITKVTATAKAAPKGVEVAATAEVAVDVLDADRAPLDVVLVLDCTGSMAKSADGLRRAWPTLFAALAKAKFNARYGLVGFRDTTLNQPLALPTFGGEPMTADPELFSAALRGLRFGGGGGEGESSLDGLAKAADYPLRVGAAARVLILVTDGPPKRADRRVKSIEDAVGHLRARRIDQLHVVALPEHRKRFEPLQGAVKGSFFDLKDATEKDGFGPLAADLAKAIVDAVPARPEPKPEPAPPAPTVALPEPKAAEVPAPPASREPDEPQFDALPLAPVDSPPRAKRAATEAPAKPPFPLAAVAGWAAAVVCVAVMLLFFGEMLLPGERPSGAALAAGYGVGVPVGVAAGALGFVALDAVGIPLLARVGAAGLFGLLLGLTVAAAEVLFRAETEPSDAEPLVASQVLTPPLAKPLAKPRAAKAEPLPELDLPTIEAPTKPPPPKPLLDLDLPPVEAPTSAVPKPPPLPPPVVAPHKPNITGAPKPGDGCPGCGRKIPGATGTRYCMVCDQTF